MSNNSSSSSQDEQPPKILWSGVTRNSTILAEAAVQDHPRVHEVAQTAKELLSKKATPGFEYHTQGNRFTNMLKKGATSPTGAGSAAASPEERRRQRPLKAIKFHVYEHSSSNDDDREDKDELDPMVLEEWAKTKSSTAATTTTPPELRVWTYAAVYDPLQATVKEVQSFLEKMVTLTENMRQYDPAWRTADTLGLQATFAPILKQRMEEVTYLGDMALLDQKVQACQLQMEDNINMILERGERLDELHEDAGRMQEMAGVFKKKAKRVRRLKMMQNAKHGIILGTAITAGVSVAVIPPLVALL